MLADYSCADNCLSLVFAVDNLSRINKPELVECVEHADVARRARRLVELNCEAPIDRSVLCGSPMRFEGEGLDDSTRAAFEPSWWA